MGYTGSGSDYLSDSVTSASRSSIVEEPTETLRIREKEKIHKQIEVIIWPKRPKDQMLKLVKRAGKRKTWKDLWRAAKEARWEWAEAQALKAAMFRVLETKAG